MIVNNLKKITIIIVVYNSSSIIFDLLKNLANFEIIIVDMEETITLLKSLNHTKILKSFLKKKI